jgi:hypothetical protein
MVIIDGLVDPKAFILLLKIVGRELYNYYQYPFTTTKGVPICQVISLDFE